MFGQPDVSISFTLCPILVRKDLPKCCGAAGAVLAQINYICALLNKHIDDSFLLSCSNLAGKSAIHVACPWISGSAGPSAACGGLCLKGECLDGSRVMLRCFPDPHSHRFFSKESEGSLWRAWRWDFGLWDGLWVTKASGKHARPSKAWDPAKKEDVMPQRSWHVPLPCRTLLHVQLNPPLVHSQAFQSPRIHCKWGFLPFNPPLKMVFPLFLAPQSCQQCYFREQNWAVHLLL